MRWRQEEGDSEAQMQALGCYLTPFTDWLERREAEAARSEPKGWPARSKFAHCDKENFRPKPADFFDSGVGLLGHQLALEEFKDPVKVPRCFMTREMLQQLTEYVKEKVLAFEPL